jgi:hypothetical protein
MAQTLTLPPREQANRQGGPAELGRPRPLARHEARASVDGRLSADLAGRTPTFTGPPRNSLTSDNV